MLPEGNQITESVFEAKKIICPLGIEVEKSIHARTVVYCSMEIMQTLTSAPMAAIGTRGKRMVKMIIMLMARTSPWRSEARRRRRLTEGLI
jgi:hypothetical protein